MKWTRLSFSYLMTYLAIGGVGLLVMPGVATSLLGSDVAYPPAILRLVGALLAALAVVVAQIRHHRVEVLYPTTLMVRGLIVTVLVIAYLESRDVMFLSLIGIVGLGVILTALGMASDRREAPAKSTGDHIVP